jgi:hypothetical protein
MGMEEITIKVPNKMAARLRARSEAVGVALDDLISDILIESEREMPPLALMRLFGSFPDLELPTRSEQWSKEER